ncbi:transmembrane GTPase fzo-1-like, partial [Saccostrea cucullata]|uniref:transmembrane GTPase fzo-1-like n=1 Tax=Saccostrea cuccullata TaxID=36930 RepID=UPI002ED50B6B
MPGSGKSNMKSIDNSRKFAEGKRCALDIINNVGNLFQTVDKAMHEARDDDKTIFETYKKTKNWFKECKRFYKNEKLKVAIFGSTSSGKSTTVNAILHKTLLPSGMGHVTNCIYKIEGSDDGKREEITFKIDEGEEEDISKLKEYLDHEQGGDLSLDRVVYITCPKLEYSALKDVIILDCPGLSRSREHDRLISDHCKDADVFVHVVDAKSTIRTT